MVFRELSILYLRCGQIVIALIALMAVGYLSILYLRCRAEAQYIRAPRSPRLSILYLRCMRGIVRAAQRVATQALSILYLRCLVD